MVTLTMVWGLLVIGMQTVLISVAALMITASNLLNADVSEATRRTISKLATLAMTANQVAVTTISAHLETLAILAILLSLCQSSL